MNVSVQPLKTHKQFRSVQIGEAFVTRGYNSSAVYVKTAITCEGHNCLRFFEGRSEALHEHMPEIRLVTPVNITGLHVEITQT